MAERKIQLNKMPIAFYRPFCAIWSFMTVACSVNRSARRVLAAIVFSTQRLMQPFSALDRDFDVKSFTHGTKQLSIKLPKNWL